MEKKGSSTIFAKLFAQPLRKGDRTKLQIVDATVKILGEQGIEGVSYESIGKEMDLPRSQVRYHFPDREVLIVKALQFAFLPMQDILMERITGKTHWMDQILALNDTLFDFIERHPREARVWVYAHSAASLNKTVRELMRFALDSGQKRVTAILENSDFRKKWKRAELQTFSLGVWAIIDMFSVYATSLRIDDPNYYRKEARRNLLQLFGRD